MPAIQGLMQSVSDSDDTAYYLATSGCSKSMLDFGVLPTKMVAMDC